jgi:hypothetical protein
MNSQYTFDPVYLTCISKKMEEAKPFGDVPSKVASSVKRSMVAMRTLIRALKSGHAIAENVKKVRIFFAFFSHSIPGNGSVCFIFFLRADNTVLSPPVLRPYI